MPRSHQPRQRRGQTLTVLVVVAVLAALGLGAFLFLGGAEDGTGESTAGDVVAVRRGDFAVTIPASGELQALRQIEIKNPLEVRAVITEIVPEGTNVKEGDVLLRLADNELRTQIKEAELQVLASQNEVSAAQNELAITRSQHASELSAAQLKVELARLALEEWREGTVKAKRQELDLAIETARKNLERLRIKFEEAQALVEREFISQDEYRQDEINYLRARADLETAELNRQVYEEYQYKREEKQKLSDLQQAEEELERVRARHEAELLRRQNDLNTRVSQLEIRQERLKELQEQLDMTVIRAPASGLVVYASSISDRGRWDDNDEVLQVGTELRNNDPVIYLPDMSQLIANVEVPEAVSGRVEPGQFATVVSDALPNRTVEGEVMSVGVLAEDGGWRDPSRNYTVKIKLQDTSGLGLKPSMRCKAEIFVERVQDALHVPLQAVHRSDGRTIVYRVEANGVRPVPVRVGRVSELYAEVGGEIEEDDRVLIRNPRPGEVIGKLPPPTTAPDATDAETEGPGGPGGPGAVDGPRGPRGEGRPSGPGRPGGPGGPGGNRRGFDGDRPAFSNDGTEAGEADEPNGPPREEFRSDDAAEAPTVDGTGDESNEPATEDADSDA